MKILLSLKGTVGDMIKALIQKKVIYDTFEGKYKDKSEDRLKTQIILKNCK